MSFYDMFHSRRLEIVKALLPNRALFSLDVGSGNGILKNQIGFPNTISSDISLGPGIMVQASAEYLPFRDQAFQLVFGGEVLEHLDYPAQALDDWVRVLAPKGTLGLSTPNGILVTIKGNRLDHKHVFTMKDLQTSLARRGIRKIRTRTIFTGLKSGNRIFHLIPFSFLKRFLLRLPFPSAISYDMILCGEKN